MILGKIDPDSPDGVALGFTSDLFYGWLWRHEGSLWVSLIGSVEEGKGHFRALLDRLEATGLQVKVPTPSGRMRAIVMRRGYRQTIEMTEDGPCTVWVSQTATPEATRAPKTTSAKGDRTRES